jgi:hypothetical protein
VIELSELDVNWAAKPHLFLTFVLGEADPPQYLNPNRWIIASHRKCGGDVDDSGFKVCGAATI